MTDSGDRLDRIEALVQANAEAISRLQAQQSETDQLIRASITDVMEIVGDLARQQQETDQRFNTLLADARADRIRETANAQDNRREHREFRAFMRETLNQLQQIWQRLAG
jgi:RNA polymerase-interacting CarD/CdnL/TRCF family regulator